MQHETTPDEIVEEYWPYDGPHNSASIISAGEALDGITRYLANATRNTDHLTAPEMHRLLGNLHAAVATSGQVYRQLASAAARYSYDRALRHDTYRDSPVPVNAEAARDAARMACAALETTAARVDTLLRDVATAHAQMAHLYHDDTAGE